MLFFRFKIESLNQHPVHTHGLAFIPLWTTLLRLVANWSDMELLLKDEIMDMALVADKPGDRAFHCHVIDHKTGLTRAIRFT